MGAPSHHMYLQCNLASMKVVAPIAKRVRRIRLTSSHHMYLQCNLASMKVVAPTAKRASRIRLTSSRESPRGWEHPCSTMSSLHTPSCNSVLFSYLVDRSVSYSQGFMTVSIAVEDCTVCAFPPTFVTDEQSLRNMHGCGGNKTM